MSKVELRRLVGERVNPANGKRERLGWNMDQLFLDGRQIAVINRVPGAPIGLFTGVLLSESQAAAVSAAVAKGRGGVKPAKIGSPIELPYELLDDEDADPETQLPEDDDE